MPKVLACSATLQNVLLHIEQGNPALASSTLDSLIGCHCNDIKNQGCAYAGGCAVQDVIMGFHQLWQAQASKHKTFAEPPVKAEGRSCGP